MNGETNVNHPNHYKSDRFECIEVMEEVFGQKAVESFCICNAFKYLYRHKLKGGMEDLQKARWYLDRVISTREEHEDIPEGVDELEERKAELTVEVKDLTEKVEEMEQELKWTKAERKRRSDDCLAYL